MPTSLEEAGSDAVAADRAQRLRAARQLDFGGDERLHPGQSQRKRLRHADRGHSRDARQPPRQLVEIVRRALRVVTVAHGVEIQQVQMLVIESGIVRN